MSEFPPSPAKRTSFVTTIDVHLADKILNDLITQGFEAGIVPPYAIFSLKKKNLSCTLYKSGKLMVQGRELENFVEFYLEPEILGTFTYKHENVLIDLSARIGIDESGKGDFFGPLCVAGVYGEGEEIKDLKTLGVQDSKNLDDAKILRIAPKIRAQFAHHIVKINPLKYNELYSQFGNLNLLLAWGHATVIECLVAKTKCSTVIVDQFAAEHVVLTALKRKSLNVNLTQKHKAEADLIVAAASILAREAFLKGLEKLGEEFSTDLPKGASAKTIQVGKNLVIKFGKEILKEVGKLHFKTLDAILGS